MRFILSFVLFLVLKGAEDDLRKVTDMAYKQVSYSVTQGRLIDARKFLKYLFSLMFVLQVVTFGMSSRVGNVSFPVRKPTELTKKFYSDKLAKLMDEVCPSSLVRT